MIMGQAAPEAGCRVDGILRYVYRLLPGFDLGNGMYGLSFLAILPSLNANCKRIHGEEISSADLAPLDAFAASCSGINIVYLALLAPSYFALTLLVDSSCLRVMTGVHRMRGNLSSLFALSTRDPGQNPNVTSSPATRSGGERVPLLSLKQVDGNAADTTGKNVSASSDNSEQAWLEVRGVGKTYPGALTASLTSLELSACPGEVLGLLGANGKKSSCM